MPRLPQPGSILPASGALAASPGLNGDADSSVARGPFGAISRATGDAARALLNPVEPALQNFNPKSRQRRVGRPYNTTTPLGRILADKAMYVAELDRLSGVNQRTITEFLARRKPMHQHHVDAIARVLDVDPGELWDQWWADLREYLNAVDPDQTIDQAVIDQVSVPEVTDQPTTTENRASRRGRITLPGK